MNLSDSKTIGKIANVAGAGAVIALLVLLGFFGSANGFIGGIGDFIGVVNSIVLIFLMIALGRVSMARHENLGRAILLLGLLGTLVRLTSGILLVSGILPYEQTIVGETIGVALMGVAILGFSLLCRTTPYVKVAYVWFSIIFAVTMIVNLVGLIGNFNDEFAQLVNRNITFAEANPILILLLIFVSPVYLLGWPVWLFWTGRLFLKEKLSIRVDPERSEQYSRSAPPA